MKITSFHSVNKSLGGWWVRCPSGFLSYSYSFLRVSFAETKQAGTTLISLGILTCVKVSDVDFDSVPGLKDLFLVIPSGSLARGLLSYIIIYI